MIDIIGTIYTQPTYDDQGEIITPPEPLPGYCVNAVVSIPAFEPFVIDTPSHPARLFGDVEHTVFLRFADRAEWLSLGIEQEDGTFDMTELYAEYLRQREPRPVKSATELLSVVVDKMLVSGDFVDEDILKLADVFQEWQPDVAVVLHAVHRFDDRLFQVIQPHTTQVGWKPPAVPALYREISLPGVIALWVQPAGSHDSYQIGDQVQWPDGTVWSSVVADNVWEPGAYGWEKV